MSMNIQSTKSALISVVLLVSLTVRGQQSNSTFDQLRIDEKFITTDKSQDDFPAIALDKTGRIFVAYVSYKDGKDRIMLTCLKGGKSADSLAISSKGDVFWPTVAVDANNRVWVIWSEHSGTNWILKARPVSNGRLGDEQTLCPLGTNIFPICTTLPDGSLCLAWQGSRNGRFDILWRSYRNNKWSEIGCISDPNRPANANDWRPSAASDSKGTVWIVWDSYDKGSYNVYLRSIAGGSPGRILPVTSSGRFHANASVAVDNRDRVWIAYDFAAENWGKDFAYLFKGGNGVYMDRQIGVTVYANGQWLQPADDLNKQADLINLMSQQKHPARYIQYAKMISDSHGQMWLVFRPRVFAEVRPPFETNYALMAMRYDKNRWSSPLVFEKGVGRVEGPFSLAGDGNRIWVASATDHRFSVGVYKGIQENDIALASFAADAGEQMELVARLPEPPSADLVEPKERQQIETLRNYTFDVDGVTNRIYRGDLHRHTEFSNDGIADGAVWDTYRYFLDAADLDWGSTSDHVEKPEVWEYQWWQTGKMADIFYLKGRFATLYGYERGIGSPPGGHWNCYYIRRDISPLPVSDEESMNRQRVGKLLFPHLKKYDAITIRHTTAVGPHSTDWAGTPGPYYEPVVEIYQGARASSEQRGGPLVTEVKSQNGYLDPRGWIRTAWDKGYKLGVIASSDHWSTHCSYACVISPANTRKDIFDAIRKRHTYGATSNIIMDFRAEVNGKKYLMGDELRCNQIPTVHINIIGTNSIKQAEVLRDGEVVYSYPFDSNTSQIRFSYKDEKLYEGLHYYYVRMQQHDNHAAWASPIWVEYWAAKP